MGRHERKKLLDYLTEMRGCSNLKEEVLDHILQETLLKEAICGLVVIPATE